MRCGPPAGIRIPGLGLVSRRQLPTCCCHHALLDLSLLRSTNCLACCQDAGLHMGLLGSHWQLWTQLSIMTAGWHPEEPEGVHKCAHRGWSDRGGGDRWVLHAVNMHAACLVTCWDAWLDMSPAQLALQRAVQLQLTCRCRQLCSINSCTSPGCQAHTLPP